MSSEKYPEGKNLFGRRVQALRIAVYGKRGMTAFARAIGITPSNLLKIERGGGARNETVEAMVGATHCSRDWLLGGEGDMFGGTIGRDIFGRSIPVVATASAATHFRTAYIDHGEHGSERLPPDLHLVKVVGESMIPVAYPGQYLLCTHDQPEHGGLALVGVEDDDELKFKRVYYRGDKVELVSIFNPDPKIEPPLLPRSAVKLHKVWGVKF
jgi:hypothetical protein